MTATDLAAGLVALLAGYAVGALPRPAATWRTAGPGWGLLAVTSALARGVLPVSVGVATWSWATGAAATIAVLAGYGWGWPPARRPGRTGGIALVRGGALTALSPVAGVIALVAAGLAAAVARPAHRDPADAAALAWLGAFAALYVAVESDPWRWAAVAVAMALPVVIRTLASRR